MNSDFSPQAYGGGGGCSFQVFALLGLLIFGFVLFASSSMAHVDLTPDTPPTYADAADPALSTEPQVISMQDSPQPVDAGVIVPITGGCANPYIVQPGDTLSEIAVQCSVSLVDLRQANPHIANANLIYPGQQLRLLVAEDEISQGRVILGTPDQQAGQTVQIPVTGPYPTIAAGARLHVTGVNFPANTPVNIAIGPENGTLTVAAAGMTDASGNIQTVLTVPASIHIENTWVVVIATSGAPAIQARSQSFYIAPGGS